MRILTLGGRNPDRFTLLSDPDYEWAVNEPWRYKHGECEKHDQPLHRAILERAGHDLTGKRVTHKNLWKLDNRRENLQITSRGANSYSRKRRNIQRYANRGFRIQVGQTAYGYAPTRQEAEDAWDEIVCKQAGVITPSEQRRLALELIELLDQMVLAGQLVCCRPSSVHPSDRYRLPE